MQLIIQSDWGTLEKKARTISMVCPMEVQQSKPDTGIQL